MAEVEFFVDGLSVGQATAGTNGVWSYVWDTSGLRPGQYELVAVARDVAGWTASDESTIMLTGRGNRP